MKKNWLIALIFVINVVALHAQFITPGTGVTWDLDDLVSHSEGAVSLSGGEYFINDDLIIATSDTIRIETNAIVRFLGGKLITVNGVFQALPPDSLFLTAADTLNTYKSFRFEDSDASVLEHCIVEYGGGIDILYSDLLIQDCIFRSNDKSNATGVIDLFFSSPTISGCGFYMNKGPAILSGANAQSSPFIRGNTMWRNNTENTNMPQINLGTSSPGMPIVIKGNTIEGFYDKAGGIAVTTLAGGNLDCVIDSNVICNNRYGITVYGFDINSVISGNVIYDNNIENLPMQGGSGINFWGGVSNASQVYGNEIYGNLWGITVTGDALPDMGKVEPDTINPGGNRIYGNGNLGTVYALYNNTPNNLNAENNYWGSYDLDSVEMVIFHYPDDETLGFVDYLPIMDSITTRVKDKVARVSAKVYPNPADSYIRVEKPGIFNSVGNLEIHVFDQGGMLAVDCRFERDPFPLDISGLIPGSYILVITDGKNAVSTPFIKH